MFYLWLLLEVIASWRSTCRVTVSRHKVSRPVAFPEVIGERTDRHKYVRVLHCTVRCQLSNTATWYTINYFLENQWPKRLTWHFRTIQNGNCLSIHRNLLNIELYFIARWVGIFNFYNLKCLMRTYEYESDRDEPMNDRKTKLKGKQMVYLLSRSLIWDEVRLRTITILIA